MKIILTNSDGNTFATVDSFEKANTAAKAIFKRNYWSNLHYEIIFNDEDQANGVIDLEPYSFHSRHQAEIFTKHLKTWWTNVGKLTPGKFGISAEDIQTANYFLTFLKAA